MNLNVCVCDKFLSSQKWQKMKFWTFQAQPVWVRVISSTILYVNVVLLYAAGFWLFSIMRLIITTKVISLLYFPWFNRAHFNIYFFNSIFLECVYTNLHRRAQTCTDLHRSARDFTGGGEEKRNFEKPSSQITLKL